MRGIPKILIIYTGGTIGMVEEAETKALHPFDFDHLTDQVPELSKLNIELHSIALDNPVDSSNMNPVIWVALGRMIEQNYHDYDGFVILHGSDTMAYTAAGLSFILENLNKPVILTGSQLPIGVIRTDGKENFLTAIEIAAAINEVGDPMVPEVAIYFEYKLYRGNRTHKFSAENFEAFDSPNYPILAEAGVHIKYNRPNIWVPTGLDLKVNSLFNDNVAVLFLFPGINETVVNCVLSNPNLYGVVLKTFGSGNAPSYSWFLDAVRSAVDNGKYIYNVTQCHTGTVEQGRYETSRELLEMGVISGRDITTEAAVAKLMYLTGSNLTEKEVRDAMQTSLRGELTV
jgi:L-asparaginase